MNNRRARGVMLIALSALTLIFGGCSFTTAMPDISEDEMARRMEKVEIVAHRGNSSAAPENTIAAIKAVGKDVDWTEFDIRVSRDGAFVLMHDEDLQRTTNGTGKVADTDLSDLRKLDAGSWFHKNFSSESVPTLKEAIAEAKATGPRPLVERKAGNAQACHEAFTAMKLDKDDFGVIAFDWDFLKALHAIDPGYHLGALGKEKIDQARIDKAKRCGADYLNWSHKDIDQAAIDLVHANGLKLFVYTVNKPDRMKVLIAMGVDGIATDDPALLSKIVNNKETQ